MDIDRFIARNQASWARLAELTGRARRGVGNLGPGELDELVQLYQRTSTHLSYVRTYHDDAALTARLTTRGGRRERRRLRASSAHPPGRWRLPHAHVPGGGVGRSALRPGQRPLDVRARHRHRCVAGRVGPRAGCLGPGCSARGVRGGGLRVLLLVRARWAVRHPGDGEQHPGVDPGLRPRDPPVRGHRVRARAQRRQPRVRRRLVRRRGRTAQVLGTDPPARAARAERRGGGRRGRAPARAGRSSRPATGAGATRWPRRAGARS